MNSAEVVMNGVQSDRMAQVFNLLAEPVREPRKSAHRYSHGQIRPLDVAGRDVLPIRTTRNDRCRGPQAYRRAVPNLFLGLPINLDQCRVVNIASETSLDSLQVNLESVSRQLHAIGEAPGQVLDELKGAPGIPLYDEVSNRHLRVSINRRPGPHVSVPELTLLVGGNILFLA